jgi:hypothetical protein
MFEMKIELKVDGEKLLPLLINLVKLATAVTVFLS